MATLRVTNLRGRTSNVAPDLPDGVNITGVGTVGIGTFTTSVVVGSAVTANADGVITSGVITATSFAGDGSSLTGIDATQIVTGNTSVQTVDTGSDGHVKVNTEGSERIRVDSSGRVGLGHDSPESFSSGAYNLVIAADNGSNAGITISNSASGTDSGAIFFAHGTGASGQGRIRYHHNGDYMAFTANATEGLRIDMGGNVNITGITTASSFSDSLGTLRSLPVNSQTSAYSLVAADAGKLIKITTGGVTCPNGESFVAGDMISIMNESGSDQTITQGGGATLYWTADGTTGNRTLGARGVATIVMAGSSAFYISGSGLS